MKMCSQIAICITVMGVKLSHSLCLSLPLPSISPPSHFVLSILLPPFTCLYISLCLLFPFPHFLSHLFSPPSPPSLCPSPFLSCSLSLSLSQTSIYMQLIKWRESVPFTFHNSLTISSSLQHLWKLSAEALIANVVVYNESHWGHD